MMFPRALSFLAMVSMTTAISSDKISTGSKNLKVNGLDTESNAGQSLMSKARQLDNNNNNNYLNWVAKYSIKFDGCSAVPEFEKDEGLRSKLLAKFRLCPNDSSCSSCPKSGEYVVELREFVEAVRNAKLEANEYNCEVQEESCEYTCQNNAYAYQGDDANGNNNGNNNGDDGNNEEYCIYQCMIANDMGFCNQDEDDMDINEFMECRAMGDDNNNNNNNNNYGYNNANYQQYYTGAYCNSKGVFLGVFSDSSCTKVAPSGTYETYSGGYSLPTDPVITYECTSCKEASDQDADNQYGNDYYDTDYVADFCEELYEQSGRCERNMDSSLNQYPDTSACEMIHTTLSKLDRAFSSNSGPSSSVVFAWMFGLGFVGLSVYVYYLRRRMGRKVDLSSSDNAVSA